MDSPTIPASSARSQRSLPTEPETFSGMMKQSVFSALGKSSPQEKTDISRVLMSRKSSKDLAASATDSPDNVTSPKISITKSFSSKLSKSKKNLASAFGINKSNSSGSPSGGSDHGEGITRSLSVPLTDSDASENAPTTPTGSLARISLPPTKIPSHPVSPVLASPVSPISPGKYRLQGSPVMAIGPEEILNPIVEEAGVDEDSNVKFELKLKTAMKSAALATRRSSTDKFDQPAAQDHAGIENSESQGDENKTTMKVGNDVVHQVMAERTEQQAVRRAVEQVEKQVANDKLAMMAREGPKQNRADADDPKTPEIKAAKVEAKHQYVEDTDEVSESETRPVAAEHKASPAEAEWEMAMNMAAQEEAARKAAEKRAATEADLRREAEIRAAHEEDLRKKAEHMSTEKDKLREAAERLAAEAEASRTAAVKKASLEEAKCGAAKRAQADAEEKAAREEFLRKEAECKAAQAKVEQNSAESRSAQSKAAQRVAETKAAKEEALRKAAEIKASENEALSKETTQKLADEKALREAAQRRAAELEERIRKADLMAAKQEELLREAERLAAEEIAQLREAMSKISQREPTGDPPIVNSESAKALSEPGHQAAEAELFAKEAEEVAARLMAEADSERALSNAAAASGPSALELRTEAAESRNDDAAKQSKPIPKWLKGAATAVQRAVGNAVKNTIRRPGRPNPSVTNHNATDGSASENTQKDGQGDLAVSSLSSQPSLISQAPDVCNVYGNSVFEETCQDESEILDPLPSWVGVKEVSRLNTNGEEPNLRSILACRALAVQSNLASRALAVRSFVASGALAVKSILNDPRRAPGAVFAGSAAVCALINIIVGDGNVRQAPRVQEQDGHQARFSARDQITLGLKLAEKAIGTGSAMGRGIFSGERISVHKLLSNGAST